MIFLNFTNTALINFNERRLIFLGQKNNEKEDNNSEGPEGSKVRLSILELYRKACEMTPEERNQRTLNLARKTQFDARWGASVPRDCYVVGGEHAEVRRMTDKERNARVLGETLRDHSKNWESDSIYGKRF